MEDVNTRQRIFLSLSKLMCGLQELTPGNFTYILYLKRIGIIARTFQTTQIHFNSDIFAAAAVVDAKAP